MSAAIRKRRPQTPTHLDLHCGNHRIDTPPTWEVPSAVATFSGDPTGVGERDLIAPTLSAVRPARTLSSKHIATALRWAEAIARETLVSETRWGRASSLPAEYGRILKRCQKNRNRFGWETCFSTQYTTHTHAYAPPVVRSAIPTRA